MDGRRTAGLAVALACATLGAPIALGDHARATDRPAISCSRASTAPLVPAAAPSAPSTVRLVTSTAPTQGSLPTWRGRWDYVDVPDGLMEPRSGAQITVDRFVTLEAAIWGGTGTDGRPLSDGALLDAASGTWLPMLPAPLCPRTDVVVTTGQEDTNGFLVYGGRDAAGHWLDDGAWYDRPSGRWTIVPPSGLPAGPAVAAALTVVVRDPATGLASASRLKLDFGPSGWTTPATVPLAPAAAYSAVALEDDDVLVVAERPGGEASMVVRDWSPDQGQWRSVADLPNGIGGSVGTASGFALEGPLSALVRETPQGVRVLRIDTTHEAGTWLAGRAAPEGVTFDPHPVVSPDHLISPSSLVAYDLLHDSWQRLPRPRQADQITFDGPSWWFEGKLYLMGHLTGQPGTIVEAFTPRLPAGSYALPTIERGSTDCQRWRVAGAPGDADHVWLVRGDRRIVIGWPDGWTVRYDPLRIFDSTGAIVRRGGQAMPTCIGSGG